MMRLGFQPQTDVRQVNHTSSDPAFCAMNVNIEASPYIESIPSTSQPPYA